MELYQVRYFLALCRERNFTQAAAHCGVSQPSFTNGIKRLELALGGQLFSRKRTGVELTALGILVRGEFVRIDQSVQKSKSNVARYLNAEPVTLRSP
jgi:LysR family hydrogen peroxide-inducible transcriptional activator